MVMISEKEFIDKMLEVGLDEYGSKRQLAFAIGLENAQTLNHWINREKVPGDWKPKICGLLNIDLISGCSNGSPNDPLSDLNLEAVDFAVIGVSEYLSHYPEVMSNPEWRKRAFKTLYKAWFNEEMRKQGAIPILQLIA